MSNRKKRGRGARGQGGVRWREDKKRYEGQIRLPSGKRETFYGDTEGEVYDKMAKRRSEFAAGITGEASDLSVSQWLTRWLGFVKPSVEPYTYRGYEQHCRLHLVPHIGAFNLAKLKAAHVQGLYGSLTEAGVSPTMQRKVGTTLTIALNEAVRLDLLPGNPAGKVRKPKAARPEIKPFDPEQAAVFLKAAQGDRLYAFYRTAMDSGARPGELLALEWPDIDFAGGFLTITKSLEEISGELRVKDTKTAKGRRRVDLSPGTMAVLAEHRKVMLAAGLIGGPVFCDSRGGHLRQSNIRNRSLKSILQRAGLPSVTLYELGRHTCATLLLLGDEKPKVVSERLGHSSITLTLDTYSHVLPTMQKRAAGLLGQLLGDKAAAEPNGSKMAANEGRVSS
jgi:integrase